MEVRYRTMPPTDAVARVLGADEGVVGRLLDDAAAAGHVEFRSGDQFSGWILTANGLGHLSTIAPVAATAPDVRRGLADLGEELNRSHDQLLDIVVDWRVRRDPAGAERLNDHSDEDHDRAVADRLDTSHRRLSPKLDRVTLCLPRYGQYRRRFETALQSVRDGSHEFLAKPVPTSYLTTWFDLRGDVLLTLGEKTTARSIEPTRDG